MIKTNAEKRYTILIHVVLILMTLIMVLPLVLLFISSITDESVLLVSGYSFFPKKFSLEAYMYIMSNSKSIFSAYGLSILVTVIGIVLSIFLTVTTAFPLSIRNLPGRKVFSFIVLFTMLFSGGLVPTYIMWTTIIGIKNTIWAYVFPGLLLNAVNVIIMRTFFQNSIPISLYEAAEIDGANYFTSLRHIVLPLGKPIIVTITLFSGLAYWNDWMNGLYYINKPSLFTVQVLLNRMIQDIQALMANSSSTASSAMSASTIPAVGVRMAIAFVALVPILLIYPAIQKYFAKGIMMGAVKG